MLALSYIISIALFLGSCNETASSNTKKNRVCKQRNGYYKIHGSCDSYISCKDFVATDMTCPDGLRFNPDTKWDAYPCSYPSDVPCKRHDSLQPAQPTAECPHQYGYFHSTLASSRDCGKYRFCAAGKATEMTCPAGLAFNPKTRLCDWPHLVPSCNAKEFLGFACPHVPRNENGEPIDTAVNYRHESDCHKFYSCELGHARLLQCDEGLAFEPDSKRCINADYVDCDLSGPSRETEEDSYDESFE